MTVRPAYQPMARPIGQRSPRLRSRYKPRPYDTAAISSVVTTSKSRRHPVKSEPKVGASGMGNPSSTSAGVGADADAAPGGAVDPSATATPMVAAMMAASTLASL